MLKKFLPNEHVESVFHISPAKLTQMGVKGVITDLDNTLVDRGHPEVTPELMQWIQGMRDHGMMMTIVSNNNERRVRRFSDSAALPFIHKARKPMIRSLTKAIKNMHLQKDEVVIVGDQILTDIYGGNRLGAYTILVVPISENDGWYTKINRRLERYLLAWMRRKGMIYWED